MDPSEYIAHHLQNLSTSHQTSIFDIHVWNLDTLFWSILCGLVTILILGLAARKATSGVPGRFQCAIEMLFAIFQLSAVEMAASNVQVRPGFLRDRRFRGVRAQHAAQPA